MRRARVFLVMLVTTAAGLVAVASPASAAATIVVNSNSGGIAADGLCTLREAIQAANTDAAFSGCSAGSGTDTIDLQAAGPYVLNTVDNHDGDSISNGFSLGPNALPAVKTSISINGHGALVQRDPTAGTPGFRFFAVFPGGDLTLNGLTLDNGNIPIDTNDYGGAIFAHFANGLHLDHTTVSNSSCDGICYGGGITSFGTPLITLDHSTLDSNQSLFRAGGLFSDDEVRITDSVISGNHTGFGGGGVIASNVTVRRSTFEGNSTTSDPGGALQSFGSLTVDQSTFHDNSAGGAGAIYSLSFGEAATITNSTVSGNTGTTANEHDGTLGPGGIEFVARDAASTLTVVNSTMTGNHTQAAAGVGGLLVQNGDAGGTATVTNSIIAGNVNDATASPSDCGVGTPVESTPGPGPGSGGNNVFGAGGGCALGSGDQTVAPGAVNTTLLTPLADNGGPTRTHALRDNGKAVDNGNATTCAAAPVGSVDQRGVTRPVGTKCDSGAYEGGLPSPGADLSASLASNTALPAAGSNVTLTATVTNGGPVATTGVTATLPIPAGYAFVSASAPAYDHTTGLWTIGNLGAGASVSIDVTVTINDGAPTDVVLEVASSDIIDPDSIPGNGVATEDDEAVLTLHGPGIFVNDDGTAINSTDGKCTLREAIIDANIDAASGPGAKECGAGSGADTIYLQNAHTYTLPNSYTLTDGLPVLTSDITIDGANSTIERASAADFRVLAVAAPGSLTLRKTIVRGGRIANCGGGILNLGATLVLDHATVTANAVVGSATTGGGGICNREGSATLVDSVVSSNTVNLTAGDAIGAGIVSFGPAPSLTLTRTTVASNTATSTSLADGGGIAVQSGTADIADATISSNFAQATTATTARATGGGIAVSGGTASVNGLTMLGNFALGLTDCHCVGGGLAVTSGAHATVSNATIGGPTFADRNVATGAGGGVVMQDASSSLTVTDSSFPGNETFAKWFVEGGGGAISNGSGDRAGGTVAMTNVDIGGNVAADGDGGGVFNRGALTITDSRVHGNKALSGGGVGNGTGVVSGGGVTLINDSIADNEGGAAGAGVSYQSGTDPMVITGGSITGNSFSPGVNAVGGGLAGASGPITVDGTTFRNNSARLGGAVFFPGGTATLSNVTVDQNTAAQSGGGVQVVGSSTTVTIEDSAITSNVVTLGGGGGIANGLNAITGASTGGTVSIERTHVDSNRVTPNPAFSSDGGGAILTIGGSLQAVDNSVLDGNTVTAPPTGTFVFAEGGGILTAAFTAIPSPVLVEDSTVSDNTVAFVPSEGGGLANQAGTATIRRSVFSGNSVPSEGGAVFGAAGTSVVVTDSEFTANHADIRGGAMQFLLGNGTVDHTVVEGNTAGNAAVAGTGTGGGIGSAGALVLVQNGSIIRNNTAGGAGGGGIYNEVANSSGIVRVTASTITGNHVPGGTGGGIDNTGIELTINDSVVNGNTAALGGGITTTAKTDVKRTTISGNRATSNGGGVWSSSSDLTLQEDTITDNDAALGGGYYQAAGAVNFFDTILAGNRATVTANNDCADTAGTITSNQFNLVGFGTGCPPLGVDRTVPDAVVATTVLFPLADNGGPTLTHALRPGSPAIDTGGPLSPFACSPLDQRNLPRPVDGDGDGNAWCDIGAFEQQTALPVLQIASITPKKLPAGSASFTLVVNGVGFDPGAVVQWNGAARPTTFVSATQVTAAIPATDLVSSADLATAMVTVQNPGPVASNAVAFSITGPRVAAIDSSVVAPGGVGSATVIPVGGASGVNVEFNNNGAGSDPVRVTAALYTGNPTGVALQAGDFYDIQVAGADATDSALVRVYYPKSLPPATEAALQLTYFDGTVWKPVLSSGGVAPNKNTTDNLDFTQSGGRFTVTFDNTSTPKLTELSGTVFALAEKETVAPTSTATADRPPNANGWYNAKVAVTLHATDDGSGVAKIEYKIDNAKKFKKYGKKAFTVSKAGVHTIEYRAVDVAGNVEASHFLTVRIDTTAPEAVVRFDPATHDVVVFGRDTGSGTQTAPFAPVPGASGQRTYTVIDLAGNATTLVLVVTGTNPTDARVVSVRYGTAKAKTVSANSMHFSWTGNVSTLTQNVAIGRWHVDGAYAPPPDQTTINVTGKGKPVTVAKPGLAPVSLATKKGKVAIEY